MSQIVDQILAASGGLNYDDDQRLFQSGDTDYRLNVIPTALGNQFVLTNMKGTTKKSHSFTHDSSYDGATYTSIGSCYDVERNAIYYFVYSDLTNHCIIRYNIDDDDFDKIVWDSTNIGLDIDNPINDAYVMDDWLFWNPRSSSPRSINVQWSYYDYISYRSEYANGTATSTSPGELVDSGQNFQDNVATNFVVYNTTNSTSATISSIDSNTTLTLSADIMASGEDYVIYKSSFAVGDYVKDKWGRVYICIQAWSSGQLEPSQQTAYFTLVTWCYDDVYSLDSGNEGFLHRLRPFFNTTFAPASPIEYEFKSSTAYTPQTLDNKIRGKVFQFTYRFYIPDLGYTVTAPFTHTVASFASESYSGEFVGYSGTDNYIQLTLNPDKIESENQNQEHDFVFEHVEILTRDGELSEWKQVVRIPREDFVDGGTSSISFDFYNDKGLGVVDSTAVEVPYNYLPNTARSQCQLDGNRSCYVGANEGFDLPAVDVDLTYALETVEYELLTSSGVLQETISFTEDVKYADDGKHQYMRYYTSAISTPGAGTAIGHLLVANVNGQDYTYTMVAGDDLTNDAYADAIVNVLNYAVIGAYKDSGPIVEVEAMINLSEINVERWSLSTALEHSKRYRTLKSGAWHSYCLYYYDDLMRRSEAIPLDPVYVRALPEELAKVGGFAGTNHRHYMNYTINHDAPSWAYWWRFGYAGNTTVREFWQYNIAAAAVSAAGDERDDLSYVDISPLQGIKDDSSLDNNFLNSNIESYSFEEGDRIRFITEINVNATDTSDLDIDDNNGTYDFEIVDFDTSTNYVYFNSDGDVGDGTGASTDYSDPSVFVEIYRPKSTNEDVIFYEIGNLSPVTGTAPSKTHNNASGELHDGDTYLITRLMSKQPADTGINWASSTTPVMLESFSWSDFYETEMWGRGKFGVSFKSGEKDLNIARYSNKYIKNTRSSGLGRFDGLDYITLSYNYGEIYYAHQIGDMLKVLFENNVASIPVNKTQFYDADGTSQVVKSDDVLGSINYSEEDYGCANPESALVVDRSLYFFDLRRKCYVRNAPNGSFPISDYKMKKYFIDKSNALIVSGPDYTAVRSGWDDDRGLLYVGFEDTYTQSNNEVILFHEDSNRWVTFASLDYDRPFYNSTQFADAIGKVIDGKTVTLTNDVGTTSQVYTVDWGSTGSFSYPVDIQEAPVIDVYNGDSVYVEISATGDTFKDDVYLELGFSAGAGPSDDNLYPGNDETYAVTGEGTLTCTLVIASSSVTNGDSADFTMLITVIRGTIPLFQSSPSDIYSTSGEDVYILNDGSTRCSFYGTLNDHVVRVYGVEAPNVIKTFDSIALHTNLRWELEDVQIRDSLNYNDGMQSEIPKERFEAEEGVLRSDYLCS
jgi:hypothetical protein